MVEELIMEHCPALKIFLSLRDMQAGQVKCTYAQEMRQSEEEGVPERLVGEDLKEVVEWEEEV